MIRAFSSGGGRRPSALCSSIRAQTGKLPERMIEHGINKQGRSQSNFKCMLGGDERVVALANKEEDEVRKMRIDGVERR
jgi:hypothetical protein